MDENNASDLEYRKFIRHENMGHVIILSIVLLCMIFYIIGDYMKL